MTIFEKLLEIKTWRTDLNINTIYISKKSDLEKLNYASYYYDSLNHTFYINWLESKYIKIRKVLEEVINESYKKESFSSFHSISKTKKPKVYLFHYSDNKEFVVIDKINIKAIRNKALEILKLKVWN